MKRIIRKVYKARRKSPARFLIYKIIHSFCITLLKIRKHPTQKRRVLCRSGVITDGFSIASSKKFRRQSVGIFLVTRTGIEPMLPP